MKLKKELLLLTFGLLLGVLVACSGEESEEITDTSGQDTEESHEEEQVLHLINGDTIPSMDPALVTDRYGFQFLNDTMEGLYRLGENNQPVEGIAMEHTVSDDGLTWTFTLREDAVWSNGDPITAHDFVYSWQRAVNPETGSQYGPYMMSGVIKNATKVNTGEVPVEDLGVTALDDYTLEVKLENPTPYFLALTTFGTFSPLNQAFVEENGDQFATNSESLLFNGPFKLENWESTSSSWEVVKNENYWDAEAVQLDKITYEVVKDTQTAIRLYEEGTVDRADLSSDLVDQYQTSDDYTVTMQPSITYLKINQTSNEALGNKNIRAAISRAFDKEALVNEILNDGSIAINGLVPVDFISMPDSDEDFREASGDLVIHNVETAQEYWEKGLEELGTDTVELELLADGDGTPTVMNEYLVNQLETNLPGLDITLKQVPFEQKIDLDMNMDYQLQVSGWAPDYLDPLTFLNLWVTDGGNNNTGYANPEYDQLIEETKVELATDSVARFENFLEAEKILFEDAVIAPIYQKALAQLVSPKVEGVYLNGTTYGYKWASVGSSEEE